MPKVKVNVKEKQKPGDLVQVLGVAFGSTCGVLWLVLMAIFRFAYSPIGAWVVFGLIPLFVLAGHFLFYTYSATKEEKENSLRLFKGMTIGFVLWLPVIAYLQLFDISFFHAYSRIIIIAGIVVMVALSKIMGAKFEYFITSFLAAFAFIIPVLFPRSGF